MKRIQSLLEYLLIVCIRFIVGILPLRLALLKAEFLGRFAFSVLRLRRRVTIENLRAAFPEKSLTECKRIGCRTYCNFAKTAIEYIRFPKLTGEELRNRAQFDHPELFRHAAEEGKGVVCVSGHFGNWEMMAAAIRDLGYPMVVVVAEQRNKYVGELINKNRNLMGIEVVSRGMAVRGILRALREKKFVALLGDQDAHEEGVFVEFMGRLSSTPQGPAALVLKTGAPMVFGAAVRGKGGYHQIYLRRVKTSDLVGVTSENIFELTKRYTNILEEFVHDYPDQWFWMHRRWKTQPLPQSTSENSEV